MLPTTNILVTLVKSNAPVKEPETWEDWGRSHPRFQEKLRQGFAWDPQPHLEHHLNFPTFEVEREYDMNSIFE